MLVLFCFLQLFVVSPHSEGFGHVSRPIHPCREMSVADRDLLGWFQGAEGEDGSVLEHQMPVGLEPLL